MCGNEGSHDEPQYYDCIIAIHHHYQHLCLVNIYFSTSQHATI